MQVRFSDRVAAGQALAQQMQELKGCDGLVLGLPRGGMPVAAEVARGLGLPLSVVPVRKIGVPGNPELAAAAIAGMQGQSVVANESLLQGFGLDAEGLERLAAHKRPELARIHALWGNLEALAALAGKTAILVDDGIATGATMRAAIGEVRQHHPARVVVATPVAAPDAVAQIRPIVDQVICLRQPEPFVAVGAHYDNFPQISDDEVSRILRAASGLPVVAGSL